jgi:NADH-ubiquinone oxidoreductase chain 4
MPVLSILFFILCLGNSGTPLTLNFIGEYMSLYGIIERLPVIGIFACSSIVFSAAYSIYMFNRMSLGGAFTKFLEPSLFDVTKKEFLILFILVTFTVIFGIYPSLILDVINYPVTNMVYGVEPTSYIPNGVAGL